MPYFGVAIGKIIGKVAGNVKADERKDEGRQREEAGIVGNPRDATGKTVGKNGEREPKEASQKNDREQKRIGLRVVLDDLASHRRSRSRGSAKFQGEPRPGTSKMFDREDDNADDDDEREKSPDIFLGKGRRSRPRKTAIVTAEPSAVAPKTTTDRDKMDESVREDETISEAETEDYTHNESEDRDNNNSDDDFVDSRSPSKRSRSDEKRSKKSVAKVLPTMAPTAEKKKSKDEGVSRFVHAAVFLNHACMYWSDRIAFGIGVSKF